MEDYYIVAVRFSLQSRGFDHADNPKLNTSTLGRNLLNATSTSSSPGSSCTSIISCLTGTVENVTSTVENDLTSIEDDLVDKLAKELGIEQWYSMHMMDLCEGTFSPNASTPGAGYNVTSCTNKTTMCTSSTVRCRVSK
jgi:hypothetical protein